MLQKICLTSLALVFICGSNKNYSDENHTSALTQQETTVGYYRNINNNLKSLSYTSVNGGVTWSFSGIFPLPSDVAANGIQNSKLQGITCNGPGSHCIAVGFYRNTGNNLAPLSYTTTNSGVNWILRSILPLPADVASNGVQNSRLQSVACDSTGSICNAVGFYRTTSNNLAPLTYTTVNSGASWSLSTPLLLPLDVAANGIQNSELQSIHCDSTGRRCSVVGYYLNTNNNLTPLCYTTVNSGTTWLLSAPLPLPNDVASNGIQTSELQSITCDSTGAICTAVGFYLNTSNNLVPLGYTTTNGGTIWSLSNPYPLPGDVATGGIQNSELQTVACDSSGRLCTTVGFYLNSSNNLVPLSYITTKGGVTWLLSIPMLLPVDVAANGIQNTKLQSMTCDNTGIYCTAVGLYLNNNNDTAPLSYTTTNGGMTWSRSAPLPLPGDVAAIGNQQTALFGIS